MGFCTDEGYERFLAVTPVVEREIAVNMGIILRKYFLDVSQMNSDADSRPGSKTRSSTGS
jgi:polyphosphate kinase 2 (PPK2 family)